MIRELLAVLSILGAGYVLAYLKFGFSKLEADGFEDQPMQEGKNMKEKQYVLRASNNQVIHWDLTYIEAEKWMHRYEAMYPEEKGLMKIEEQWF